MIITLVYMVTVCLMVDIPDDDENWSITPELKNGPIARGCIIILYIIVMFAIYKNEDNLINFRSDNNILTKAKMKYYLYNLS